MADTLQAGQELGVGEMLISQDGRFRLVLQTDSNLVLYGPHDFPWWASNTVGKGVTRAVMQDDGNFVLYGAQAVWASNTNPHPGSHLILQNDGNTVIYGPAPIWASNTDENAPKVFDSGELSSPGGLPLSGNCQLHVWKNGDFAFQTHAHDAGFDNIHYQITGLLVTASERPFVLSHSGGLDGTSGSLLGTPRRDDDWNSGTQNNPQIAAEWSAIMAIPAQSTARIDGTDVLGSSLEDWVSAFVKGFFGSAGSAAGAATIKLL